MGAKAPSRVLLQFAGNKRNDPKHGAERPGVRVARMAELTPLAQVYVLATAGDGVSSQHADELAGELGKHRRGGLKVSTRPLGAGQPPDPTSRASVRESSVQLVEAFSGSEFGARFSETEFLVSAVTGTPAQWTSLVDALDGAGARLGVVWERPDGSLAIWRVHEGGRSVEPELALLDCAPAAWNILLSGPTGAGKSEAARRLHNAWQRHLRRGEALVSVNAAAIPRDLLESTLFGYEKGAFTGATESKRGAFQEAQGGTLFLDEVGDLPFDQQVRLLTALDLGPDMRRRVVRVGARAQEAVDVRLILGTNRDLYALAREGRFRHDLLGRISTHQVQLPPLAEVRHRIPGAYLDQLERLAGLYPVPVRFTFDRDARLQLQEYMFSAESRWPWNHRDVLQSAERLAMRAWADGHGRRPGVGAAGGRAPLASNITARHVERELRELRTRHSSLGADGLEAGWAAVEASLRPEAWERMPALERWELRYLLEARTATTTKADAWRWIAERNLLDGARDEASMNNPSNAFDKRWRRYAARLRG